MNSNPEIVKSESDPGFYQSHQMSTRVIYCFRNLNSLPKHLDYSLDSPPFVFQNATWCLRLYPNGNNFDCIRLEIVRLSSRVPRHTLQYFLLWQDADAPIRCRVVVFDKNDKEMVEGSSSFRHGVVCYPFVSRGDSVKIICHVISSELHAVDAFSQTEVSIQDTKDVGDLRQHFKTMLLNGQDHDVVLKVKDKEFRAHRNILRARSPVLESMLGHDMVEKNSGAIDIPDCDPSAFQQFLIYLYSGEVGTLDADNVLLLYYIADKYDAGHLKEECREFIKASLSAGNVADVVQTALDHSDADLLGCATLFFAKEMRSVVRTVEWQSFMKRNPIQANELIIKATE